MEVKGSPYSITERRVPELIPVLGCQPADDMSHKPDGRLLLVLFYCFFVMVMLCYAAFGRNK